ncbi:hypothetical protein ACSSS7_000884 [Eimeria intestinalis]
MAWAHQGVSVAAAALCTPDSRRAGPAAFHRSGCRSALPTESASRAASMVSPLSPSRVASLADSVLTEEAQAVSEELVRAARNWQEEHREWQRRYSQWLAEQSHWDYARHAAACAAADGGRSFSSSMRQSTCSAASGVLSGAMRRALFAGRKATSSVCSRAANRTRRGLVPAARRLGRRLKAALAKSTADPSQQQQQLQLQQQQHDEFLLRSRQQRLVEEQLLQQQQRSFMELELLQQRQQQHAHQQQRRQQQRHMLAASQQVQQLQPQQQHTQQQQEDDDDDEYEEWSQREEEEGLQEGRVVSEPLEASPAVSKTVSTSRKALEEGEGLTQVNEVTEEDEWEDEEQVLQGLNSSINWIVDVGLNPAARAAAAAALQRREKLLQQQQQQQQQQQKQGKRFDAENSRASSAATCCDSVGASEEGVSVHHGQNKGSPLQTRDKLVQTPRAAVVRCRQKLRFQPAEGAGRTLQREESECSLEDCVLHSHDDETHGALSDTNSCNSSSSSSSSSVSSAYLERRLRASRRLREAAAAAKKRQLALAQRRAEAAKREELCYNEQLLFSTAAHSTLSQQDFPVSVQKGGHPLDQQGLRGRPPSTPLPAALGLDLSASFLFVLTAFWFLICMLPVCFVSTRLLESLLSPDFTPGA